MGLLFGKAAPLRTDVRLDGKTVIITGANTGIGKVTAEHFVKLGGRVIIACRDVQKAEAAAQDIRTAVTAYNDAGEVIVQQLDLSSLKSVRECAQRILETEPKIHLLVNNAGVSATPYTKTVDGFELQIGTNHLGHFLFTCLLLPRIIESAPARIVNVSSDAQYFGEINFEDLQSEKKYGAMKAYYQSKLANVLFAKELARRLKGTGVTTYSLHPGIIKTELTRSVDQAFFPGSRLLMAIVFYPFSKTLEQGAATTIHCSLDEKAGTESGLFYRNSAVAAPGARALDEETAKRLWEESVRLVKLDSDPFSSIKTNEPS